MRLLTDTERDTYRMEVSNPIVMNSPDDLKEAEAL